MEVSLQNNDHPIADLLPDCVQRRFFLPIKDRAGHHKEPYLPQNILVPNLKTLEHCSHFDQISYRLEWPHDRRPPKPLIEAPYNPMLRLYKTQIW